MRIIGGEYRGRALKAPDGQATRPTSDRAREAVFNILEHAPWSSGLVDARVVDLFAGSGALGLEALSRGAAWCLFVDMDAAARGAIRLRVRQLRRVGFGSKQRGIRAIIHSCCRQRYPAEQHYCQPQGRMSHAAPGISAC